MAVCQEVCEYVFQFPLFPPPQLHVDKELPLAQAAEAHRILESRGTTGKLLLRC